MQQYEFLSEKFTLISEKLEEDDKTYLILIKDVIKETTEMEIKEIK